MSVNLFTLMLRIPALMGLVSAAQTLAGEVASAQADPEVVEALKSAPLTRARLAKVSAEIRSVQNDAGGVIHDKNFFSKLNAASHLLKDAGVLERDGGAIQADPAIAAELAASPVLQARISTISAEWRTLEQEFGALGL